MEHGQQNIQGQGMGLGYDLGCTCNMVGLNWTLLMPFIGAFF